MSTQPDSVPAEGLEPAGVVASSWSKRKSCTARGVFRSAEGVEMPSVLPSPMSSIGVACCARIVLCGETSHVGGFSAMTLEMLALGLMPDVLGERLKTSSNCSSTGECGVIGDGREDVQESGVDERAGAELDGLGGRVVLGSARVACWRMLVREVANSVDVVSPRGVASDATVLQGR